jgi:MFS family permease
MPPQAEEQLPPRLALSVRRSTILIVATTILIDFIGFGVLIPVLPEMVLRLGAGAFQISLILAAYALAQLLFLPVWGWCSDRWGRRPVLLVSLGGTVASFMLLAAADGLWLIYVSRILGGFFAASVGTAQAVITDVTEPSERAGGMGKIGASAGVALVIGPALGGILDDVGPGWPFYAVSGIAAINLLIALFALPETRPSDLARPPLRDLGRTLIPVPIRMAMSVHDRRIAVLLYLWFHLYLGFAVVEASLPIYLLSAHRATPFDVGLLFAALGVVVAITQGWLVGRITTRANEFALLILGCSLTAVGLGTIPLVDHFGALYAVGGLIAIGHGLALPIFTSLYSRACTAGEAGELLGDGNAMGIAGRVLGAVGAGLLMDHVDLGAPFWAAAAVMGAAALLFALLSERLRSPLPTG